MIRTLPHPAPRHWRVEGGDVLAAAIERYISQKPLTVRDVAVIRAYVRQWVDSPAWEMNPHMTATNILELALLRAKVLGAKTKDQVDACIELAITMGMDPL